MSNRPTKTSRPTAVAHIAVAVLTLLCGASLVAPGPTAFAAEVAKLAAEVKAKGWIAYGARAANGDWDLFLCRPDGTGVHPLTRTPELNEFSPQFSRDGRKLLYRRIPRDEVIDNNHHGEQGELVLARSDGQDAIVFGKPGEYPWASWNADATQIACLSIKGITLVDVAGRRMWPAGKSCGRCHEKVSFSSWCGRLMGNGWREWPTRMGPVGASPAWRWSAAKPAP